MCNAQINSTTPSSAVDRPNPLSVPQDTPLPTSINEEHQSSHSNTNNSVPLPQLQPSSAHLVMG